MTRVLVVGGGLAGCVAAAAATRDGAEVTLAWRAPGATALYSGAMEIAGDLGRLPAGHPLCRLGMDAMRIGSELDDAQSALVSWLQRAGLELVGSARRAGLYADLLGRPRSANLVPAGVAPGELSALRGRRVAVVGIAGVSEYDAESTAQAMRELCGIDAFAHAAEVGDLPPGASLTDLYGRAAPALRGLRAEAVAFPPGLAGLPDRGFELLAVTPGPHGHRLQLALEAMVAAAGVTSVQAPVHGFEGEGTQLRAALVGDQELAADSFVLATGRFIGGGLVKRRRTHEPLLGLGVFWDGEPAAASRRLPRLEYLDPAPAFQAGLLTDDRLRPLGEDGRVAYQNLRAAGAVLGGWDEGGEMGFGVPLLTGWLAGRWSAA
ncbi:MAG TPA: FAD-binding protein [Candidatus Dormibacteraeota bacterium]